MILKLPGVYEIGNSLNGRSYYGQSDDVRVRIGSHINALNKGIHLIPEMQKDFDLQYGKDFFARVVVYTETDMLNDMEVCLFVLVIIHITGRLLVERKYVRNYLAII